MNLPARLQSALAGRYELNEQIGRGGMATVYAARDVKHNRNVAIKVLRPDLGAAIGTDRFLREIQVAARLRHPHIIPLFDSGEVPPAGESPALLYYIMPLVEGESLRALLEREGPLPVPMAIKIATEVADALGTAHAAGVVHRDIKPENILLERGHAMVADFGISRAVGHALLNPDRSITETGLAIGTPAYMSPEQIEGRANIDGSTDIYSLACVLFEMLAGRPPFTGPTPTAVAARHLMDPVPRLRPLRPEVTEELEASVLRGMSKSPEERYDTAETFSSVLTQADSGIIRAASRRRRTPLLIGGIALLLVAAAVGFVRWNNRRPPMLSNTTLAVLPFSVRGPDTLHLGEGMVTLLSTKMDGAGDLRAVDGRALLSYLDMENVGELDREGARRVAQHFSAGKFVLGEVVALGSRLQLTARLYDHEDDEPKTASEEGDISNVFQIVDRLAARLLAQLSDGPDRLDQIAGVSTTSLPAFRAYLTGESAMRTGKFDEARNAYLSATQADTNFALAWYRLSVAGQWLAEQDLVQEASRRAQRLSTQLPERSRRLLEANIASNNGDLVTAERIFRGITGSYPDDVEAWMQLAEMLFHDGPAFGRDSRESEEPWRRAMAYEPYSLIPLIHLARLAAFDRDTAQLDSLVSRVRSIRAQTGQTVAAARAEELELTMLEAVVHRDSATMERTLIELAEGTSLTLAITLWDVSAFTNDFEAASRIAALLASPSRDAGVRAVGYGIKGSMALGLGQWKRGMVEFDSADQMSPGVGTSYRAYFLAAPFRPIPDDLNGVRQSLRAIQRPATPPPPNSSVFFKVPYDITDHVRLYLQGLYAALAGDPAAVARYATELEGLGGSGDQRKLSRNLAQGIRAEIALRQGDSALGLRHLLQATAEVTYLLRSSQFYAGLRERYRRGELLEQAGRNEEALRWFTSLESQTNVDGAYLAPSLLARGRLSEKIGRLDNAARHYERMLQLWQHADPEFRPMIEEARAGLRRVRGER